MPHHGQAKGHAAAPGAHHTRPRRRGTTLAAPDLRSFDVVILYRAGWSAEQMLDTDVRGPQGVEIGEVKDIIVGKDGQISKVVVEVGGFLEIGDQHIGVPWNHVTLGRDMQWVQVPLREVEDAVSGRQRFDYVERGEQSRQARAPECATRTPT